MISTWKLAEILFKAKNIYKMGFDKKDKSMSFAKIGESTEIAPGEMKKAKVGDNEFLIANVNGKYYAIGARCTHAGGDLSQGSLEGNIITCPKHKAKFDVTTGRVVSGPKIPMLHLKIKDEPSYQVAIDGNTLLVKTE